jgi:hypothetical protein
MSGTAQRSASVARRWRDEKRWRHMTARKSRAQVDSFCVGSTRQRRRHDGRSAASGTHPRCITGRIQYGRACSDHAYGPGGHHGRSAPLGAPAWHYGPDSVWAGTSPPRTTGYDGHAFGLRMLSHPKVDCANFSGSGRVIVIGKPKLAV